MHGLKLPINSMQGFAVATARRVALRAGDSVTCETPTGTYCVALDPDPDAAPKDLDLLLLGNIPTWPP